MHGRLLINYPKTNHPDDFYQDVIALDGVRLGEYLLRIKINDWIYGEKIIKQ
jgi:hypothetical protein